MNTDDRMKHCQKKKQEAGISLLALSSILFSGYPVGHTWFPHQNSCF